MNFLRRLVGPEQFVLLQGGMGIGASAWFLARAMAMAGAVGTVSGTAIHHVFVRRLQLGDPGGNMKRAVDAFPFQKMAQRLYQKYFIPGGKKARESFVSIELCSFSCSRELIELIILSNFVEVFLAKEGHDGVIGINFLEKVRIPHLYSIYGAMLAGVDFIVMGAGLPRQIPGVLKRFMHGEAVEYKVDVTGAPPGSFAIHFDPKEFFKGETLPALKCPGFMPIVTYTSIAQKMTKEYPTGIDAFVVEGFEAAGHNPVPRVGGVFDDFGEPVYGPKDKINLAAMRLNGKEFILAGGWASPQKIAEAIKEGASGIQFGSLAALCEESGIAPDIRNMAKRLAFCDKLQVVTSLTASPTGYAFKYAKLSGTLSDPGVYVARKRRCDIGLLREPYLGADGEVHFRCCAEQKKSYLAKGGDVDRCNGAICLCNGLLSAVGLAQVREDGYVEPPILTLGGTSFVKALMIGQDDSYSAADAIAYLRREIK